MNRKPNFGIDERMINGENAKNGPYCYFYKGETEKATKKRFGFG